MNELVVSSDRTFSRALFGLNKVEVYTYLNEISSAYEELQLQITVLKDQNNKLADSNRDNALKLYNLQNDITEAQKKSDLANAELEAAKKEATALRQELEAAKKRITKLTDELIKANASGGSSDEAAQMVAEEKAEETISIKREPEIGFTPKPIFGDEEPVKAKDEPKDIFAELRNIAEKEKQSVEEPKKPEPVVEEPKKFEPEIEEVKIPDSFIQEIKIPDSLREKVKMSEPKVSSAANVEEDEVYAGEVEIKLDDSMLIGNEDDEDEGFNFL